ncbi:MAG: PIG-L family deacetylase [Flavobacteriales bacterium]|nr:PIG-L family deacetylase [Flavobacteriales bacterium]
MMEARRIDGGEQFFTRAVDFGYSKSAEESFEKWGHDEVLSDVVRVIRQFRPDIIITRFPPTREAGHGHHEASAILAEEAFKLAGDPKAFPEQLNRDLKSGSHAASSSTAARGGRRTSPRSPSRILAGTLWMWAAMTRCSV